jgi:hypothetical protein
VVTGTDLASMLVHVWTARSFGAGVRPWPEFLRTELRRGGLPDRVDLASVAEKWVPRVGVGRVHVVLDDQRQAARLVGRRRQVAPAPPLSADAIELGRRTAPVVGSLVTPERRTALMRRRLRPVLAAYPGPQLRVSPRDRPHLVQRTTDLRQRLAGGNYSVHGALPEPAEGPGIFAPNEERVLALAIQVLLGPPIGTELAERPADGR